MSAKLEMERKESYAETKEKEKSTNNFINSIKEPFSKLANWMVIPDKKKKVYMFNEGGSKDRMLLGNKGTKLMISKILF